MEHAEAAGEKLARLGELGSRVGCRVPDGFVITTRACQEFLDAAGVRVGAEALRTRWTNGGEAIEAEARKLQARILEARIPKKLEKCIRSEVAKLQDRWPDALFAVRSSATDEDGDLTFAGQYETILGVDADAVVAAYRSVVASLYAPSVVRYRRRHDLPPGCGFMAVGCLRMVPASASGVVYSLNPSDPASDVQLVTSAWGLGKAVVEGEAPVDRFEVLRRPGYPISSARIGQKDWRYMALPGRGVLRLAVPNRDRDRPSLTEAQASELAEVACRIERYMKAAQDVEWALDGDGALYILQTRPLTIPPANMPEHRDLSDLRATHPVVFEGRGDVACRGIGTGRVHLLDDHDGPPKDLPLGVVLVARKATPRLGGALAGVGAVITDLGSATGHFAAVARDFRVPTIVATEVATSTLREGMEVTVDAEENVVYQGRVDELLHDQLLKRASFEDASEFRMLRRLVRKIAPLGLEDPQTPGFAPDRCRTYHDVIRFAHEKAIEELLDIGWVKPSDDQGYARPLELPIPLDLVLIDLGGGFQVESGAQEVTLEEVSCRPLKPLLEALTAEGAWDTTPADMDLDGFMASATRAASLTGPMAARPAQNLAIVSERYLHLSLRVGYHFNIVDAHLTDRPEDNHVYFRFAGGVTELTRRSRRAALLKRILEDHGFVTEGREDLVIGRLKGFSPERMVEQMRMIGQLIGFTRQLDIFLRNDQLVDQYVERFMGRVLPTSTPQRPERATEAPVDNAPEVLVLDDEPVVSERLKDHLEKRGYRVESFTDSQQAVDRLAAKRFDVVITDLKMTGPTGLDVLRFVRDQSHGTQVIIITGYGSMDAARLAEFGGAFEFVHKPFNMKTLEATIRKAARKAHKLMHREAT
jgi:pyruvate,water dikinase